MGAGSWQGRNSSMAPDFAREAVAEGKLAPFSLESVLEKIDQVEYQALCKGAEVLEADCYGEKVFRLTDGTILKLFRRKRLLSSAILYPYARRFVANASALARLGVPVPHVLRLARIPSIGRDAVHYEPLAGITLRELARKELDPMRKKDLLAAFTRFVIGLHDKGVYFRSLHIGNVVLTPDDKLGLIDFSDLRIHPWSLGRYLRIRNMRRMSGIPEECDWLDLDSIAAGKLRATGNSE